MDKLIKSVFFLLLLAVVAPVSFAQQEQRGPKNSPARQKQDSVVVYKRPHVFKTNLLGPLSFFYEVQMRPKRSLQISVNRFTAESDQGDIGYFVLTGAYKFYVSNKVSTAQRPFPSGFYVSPYVRYGNVRDSDKDFITRDMYADISYNLFGGGATMGYQVIFQKGFTLDFFGGAGYLPFNSTQVKYYFDPNSKPESKIKNYQVDVRLGLCVGFALK